MDLDNGGFYHWPLLHPSLCLPCEQWAPRLPAPCGALDGGVEGIPCHLSILRKANSLLRSYANVTCRIQETVMSHELTSLKLGKSCCMSLGVYVKCFI